MNGEMQFAAQQLVFDFLGEKSFATSRRQRHFGKLISAGLDDFRFDPEGRLRLEEQTTDELRLCERQWAAACADDECVHGYRCFRLMIQNVPSMTTNTVMVITANLRPRTDPAVRAASTNAYATHTAHAHTIFAAAS